MTLDTFYSIVSASCFALVGLWWNVVAGHREWFKDTAKRDAAGGIYLSFLIPAIMGLGSQIGGDNKLIWRAVFVLAALCGMIFTARLIVTTRALPGAGLFRQNQWLIIVLYAVVLAIALFPDLAPLIGLTGLQVEAITLCLLILIGHGLAWEFMTEA